MYNFSQLSPADFEELSRDLLQKHWAVTLESFRNGRDAGIDLRYAADKKKTVIIQCKHYLGSGFRKLLRDLVKEEKPKVTRLSPSRYVIITSLPLNPQEKDAIVSAMHPYVKGPGDVIGQETLNNLLRQYPEIEESHFKLWLSSIPVLERVLHNAEKVQTEFDVDRVRRAIPFYVQNKAYAQALEILDEQKFVIISGVPGIGKITLADLLLFILDDDKSGHSRWHGFSPSSGLGCMKMQPWPSPRTGRQSTTVRMLLAAFLGGTNAIAGAISSHCVVPRRFRNRNNPFYSSCMKITGLPVRDELATAMRPQACSMFNRDRAPVEQHVIIRFITC